MKITKYLRTVALAAAVLFTARATQAQIFPNGYINVDWQVGVPLDNGFADNASGWGMNFEGGYFVTPSLAVGPFISFQTNHESLSYRTIDFGDGTALSTAQKHSLFQLPFGLSARYSWLPDSIFQPYAGVKLGANYAEMSSYYYVIKQYTGSWGFYVSPEIGVSIFPNPANRIGIHVAAYYSFATNEDCLMTYSINNVNNFGVRVGISF